MFHRLIAAVRSIRRPRLKAALLAATILAAGGTSANAQVLYADNNFVEVMSTFGQYEYVKQTNIFTPWTYEITVYFDAGATSAAPNYIIYLYLVDWTEGGVYYGPVEVRDGITDRGYAVPIGVNLGHEYSIVMYVSNVQDSARWWFYTHYLEIVED
jgi:hypothetical protein